MASTETPMGLAILIVLSVACMYLSGQIALRRGRSFKAWLWLTAFFGPFALIAVAALPPLRRKAAA
jgi:hypothetical protein